MYGAELVRRWKASRSKVLLLGLLSVLGIGCFTLPEGRYVPHIEVAAVSVRDGSAEGSIRSELGQDPQGPVSGSRIQTIAPGGGKLLAAYDDHVEGLAPSPTSTARAKWVRAYVLYLEERPTRIRQMLPLYACIWIISIWKLIRSISALRRFGRRRNTGS